MTLTVAILLLTYALEIGSGVLVAGVGLLVFTGLFARLAGLFTFGVI